MLRSFRNPLKNLARPAGFEPATCGLEGLREPNKFKGVRQFSGVLPSIPDQWLTQAVSNDSATPPARPQVNRR